MQKLILIKNKIVKRLVFSIIVLILPIIGFSRQAIVSSVDLQQIPNKLIVGYWHNWGNGLGYRSGNCPAVDLKDINSKYNAIMVSFMKVYPGQTSHIPTFNLDPAVGMTEAEFIDQIKQLNLQGRLVLISLGGADAHIALQNTDVNKLAEEIIKLTDRFGFNGLDIDLEQSAIVAADNQQVIPQALKIVKNHYKQQNKNFVIAMAPEFPYLRKGGSYTPYLESLEGLYDWISPQFYNQGGDGIYVEGVGYVAQNNNALKKDFVYHISKAIIEGDEYYNIPHNKLVFGLPANIDAANNGYIQNPNDLIIPFKKLEQEGTPLRGIMTWSVNWDVGTNVSGKSYNSSFINAYGDYFIDANKQTINKPVILGADNTTILLGSDNFDVFKGVQAIDKEDGDITANIIVTGDIDPRSLGDYTIIYRVTDSNNNTVTKKRIVSVVPNDIKITGADHVTIKLGDNFDPLAGVKAVDFNGNDITNAIKVKGSVNTDLVVQNYTLVYTIKGNTNNKKEVTRIVEVIADKDDLTTTLPTGVAKFNINKQYMKGDQVEYNGIIYIATRWTDLGKTPDMPYTGWKLF
jgi:chitinase